MNALRTLFIRHGWGKPLIVDSLKDSEFEFVIDKVDARDQLVYSLRSTKYDLIIYQSINGMTNLEVIRECKKESTAPFIAILDGINTESAAYELMKAGAADFVLQNHSKTLGFLVSRIVREAHSVKMVKDAEQERDIAIAQAYDASQAKDRFIATLSHELRTPLTPIVATLSALKEFGDVPATLQDDIDLISRNIDIEAKLIDDLLDLNSVLNNRIHLRTEPISLHSSIASSCMTLQESADMKKITFMMQFDAEDSTILGDSKRVSQVLFNLLSNAIKYSEEGHRVSLRTWNENDEIKLEVIDSGCGMDKDCLERMFRPLEPSEGKQSIKGLGLGLALSKAFMDLHGGSISAQSKGKGGRFTI